MVSEAGVRGFSDKTKEADDPLGASPSFEEFKKIQIQKRDDAKYLNISKIEDEIGIPYQLHGIQQKPDQKKVICRPKKRTGFSVNSPSDYVLAQILGKLLCLKNVQ